MGLFGDATGVHFVVWMKGFLIGVILVLLIVFLARSGIITIPFLSC